MAENTTENTAQNKSENTEEDAVHEVAAVFHDEDQLQKAVDALIEAGFPPAAVSVMGAYEAIQNRLDKHYEPVTELEDDPRVPQKAFVPRDDRRVEEAVVIGAPMYLLGVGGALAAVATGGAAALALAAAAAGGAVGGGIGLMLERVLEKAHAQKLAKDLEAGGILLWVAVANDEREKLAIDVLKRMGGDHVHAHRIARTWGAEDVKLMEWNPDPFLGKDPV